jgi:uncharacterized spore protein YtfJ
MENNVFLETLAARFGQNASVKNVYGEPITTQGKTIIPVAQIAMGLGGGYGHKNGKGKQMANNSTEPDHNKQGEGAGAGGGMYATAKGVYEVTDKCTRFIPANATKQLLAMAALAFVTGRWMGRRKRRKEQYKGFKA